MLRFFRRLLFLFNSYSPNSPLNLWNINLTIVIFFLFFLSFFGNPALALGWTQSWFLVNSFSGMFCKKSKGQRGDASSPEPMPGFGGKEQGRGRPFLPQTETWRASQHCLVAPRLAWGQQTGNGLLCCGLGVAPAAYMERTCLASERIRSPLPTAPAAQREGRWLPCTCAGQRTCCFQWGGGPQPETGVKLRFLC